jgi:hypothetical protein
MEELKKQPPEILVRHILEVCGPDRHVVKNITYVELHMSHVS